MKPSIDTTDAAAILGLTYAPGVRPKQVWQHGAWAWGYDHEDIMITSFTLSDPLSLRLGPPIREIGIDPAAQRNAKNWLRWIVAHELTHHLQRETTPDFYSAYLRAGGPSDHVANAFERHADRVASQIWPFVRIDGHMAREARGRLDSYRR